MWARLRRAPLLATTALAGAVALAGCSTYQPVSRAPGQSWVEARAAAARAAAGAAAAQRRTHEVQPGESVGRLARRYEVKPSEIIAANGLAKPYALKTGQRLVIPSPAPALPPPEAPATVAQGRAAREATVAAVAVAELPAPPAAAAAAPAAPPPARPAAARAPLPEPDPAVLRRAQEATPPPLSGDGFLQPVPGRLVSGFGDKGDGRRNDGINLAAPRGTPVRAAENGIVVYAGESIPGFGVLLLIRHADGFTTAYGHLEQALVAVGDRVARGQVVARVGDSGDVKTAQLHFQLRNGATAVDPRPHLVATSVEVAARPSGRAPGG